MSERKVILYIAVSVDGYIAKENDDISFLSVVETPGEDYGYHDFVNCIDTVVMGRKTYDKVLSFGIEFPHKGKKVYVWSRSRKGQDENVTYINDSLKDFILQLKSTEGKNIFIDGGAALVNELLKLRLIDQLVISIVPYMLGGGVKLFSDGRPEQNLKLLKSVAFSSGLLQLWYSPYDK